MSVEPPKEISDDTKKYIASLNDAYIYNVSQFDKQALLISSGAIAISLTIVKEIVPLANVISLWSFYTAVIFFALSIIVGFLSFLISSEIQRKNRLIAEKFLTDWGKKFYAKVIPETISRYLNYVNATLIVLGIIFIIVFTFSNLEHFTNIIKIR